MPDARELLIRASPSLDVAELFAIASSPATDAAPADGAGGCCDAGTCVELAADILEARVPATVRTRALTCSLTRFACCYFDCLSGRYVLAVLQLLVGPLTNTQF